MALDQEMVRADHGTKLFALLGVAGVVTAGIVFALVGSPSRARDSRSDAPVAQVTFGPVGLAAPDRIGVLSKVADSNPATVSRANPLVAVADQSELFPTLPKVPPVYPEKVIVYSAVYEHSTTPSRQVIVWGGVGPGASAPLQFDLALNKALLGIPRATEGARADLRWRRPAGHGSCRSLVGGSDTYVVCGWAGQNAAVIMEFAGWNLDESVRLTRKMLDSIVLVR